MDRRSWQSRLELPERPELNMSALSKALLAASTASVAHAIWRFAGKVLEVRRMRKTLQDVPLANYDSKGSIMGWLKAVKPQRPRVHDWFDEVTCGFKVCKFLGISWDASTTLVVVRDPAGVKHLLKDNFRVYDKPDGKVMFWHYMEKWLGKGIFLVQHGDGAADKGAEWYLQRKVSAGVFTRGNFQNNFQEVFATKGAKLCDVVDSKVPAQTAFDMQELFFDFTMDAAMKVLLGEDNDQLSDDASKFSRAFDDAHFELMRFLFPWQPTLTMCTLLPWPLGGLAMKVIECLNPHYQRFKRANRICHSLAQQFVAKARADAKASERQDLLSLFLRAEETQRSFLSDVRLKEVVLNFLFAGRDTTACTLSWMFYVLATNPEIQSKLAEEVDRVLPGGEVPSLKSISASSMPYLNGVLYEVLRLHPALPTDQKIATADDVMPDGSKIAAGARVIFLPRAMGRDPEVYKDPLKVKPERWIPFSAPSPFEFPVFQAGPRICLGMDMANFEVKVVAAMLIQKFRFTMDPEEAAKVTYRSGVTMAIRNSETEDGSNALLLMAERRNQHVAGPSSVVQGVFSKFFSSRS